METAENNNQKDTHTSGAREPRKDIISGASETSQLKASEANAAQDEGHVHPSSAENLMEVNKGDNSAETNDPTPEKDEAKPSIRGI